jgi:hypothetical protein
MDEIHHFYGENPTFIQDSQPQNKTNLTWSKHQIQLSDLQIQWSDLHTTLKPKIAEIEKIKK